jgi:hypothetical protein
LVDRFSPRTVAAAAAFLSALAAEGPKLGFAGWVFRRFAPRTVAHKFGELLEAISATENR